MRILLADDHELVRDGIKPILSRLGEGVVILEAETFQGAMQTAANEPTLALAILDLKMPGMNGVAGVQAMRSRFPDLIMAVLSGSIQRTDVMAAMMAGAAAYIPKTTGGPAILNALRLVLCGEKYFPPELIAPGTMPPHAAAPSAGLSALLGEREVVRLVLEGKSNKEIARDLGVEEVTVKKRLSRIYKQFGVDNRVQLLIALGVSRPPRD